MRIPVIFSVLLFCLKYELYTALQCYVCENCIEGQELQELHICGELPGEISGSSPAPGTTVSPLTLPGALPNDTSSTRRRRTTTTTTTTVRPAAVNPGDSEEYYYEYYYEDDGSAVPRKNVRKLRSADRGRAMKEDDKVLDFDDSEEKHEKSRDPRIPRQSLGSVCFMIKFEANNTLITKRGCSSLVNADDNLTCLSLFNDTLGATRRLDCQLCSENGCNKFVDEFTPTGPVASGAKSVLIRHFLLMLPWSLVIWKLFK